jgi:hypothetical protein
VIAYKAFQLCPASQRPPGIPLAYPWIQQPCTEEEKPSLVRAGWTVMSDEDYESYVSGMSDLLAAYETARTQLGIESVVSAATQFGQSIMISFAAENVLLGITQENKTGEVLDKLVDVLAAVQAGSLYEVMSRIRAIPVESYDAKYITAARLLVFINKIEEYLGLPASTSL